MESLEKLEATLDESLNKNAPVKLPPDGRKALAGSLWWIALVIGIIQLYVAITLWEWGHATDTIVTTINYYTGVHVRHLGLFYYLSLLSMAAVAVLMLLAAPTLKAMKKSGWDLLFYGVLVEAVAAVFQLFADGAGISSFFGSALGTVVGAFLLFQARDYFIMSHPAPHKAEHKSRQLLRTKSQTKLTSRTKTNN